MKASPNAAIIRILAGCGLHIDASSGYECDRAMRAGIPAAHISLSTQEFPDDFRRLFEAGIRFNACSLNQLRRFGEQFPGGELGLRINPGLGSGGTVKTNVGGPASSFGIWHEYRGEARAIIEEHGLRVVRIHTHIGSGSDPAVWQHVARLSLEMVREFPSVTTLNLGGGFKVGRMSYEQTTDFQEIGQPIREALRGPRHAIPAAASTSRSSPAPTSPRIPAPCSPPSRTSSIPARKATASSSSTPA